MSPGINLSWGGVPAGGTVSTSPLRFLRASSNTVSPVVRQSRTRQSQTRHRPSSAGVTGPDPSQTVSLHVS